MALNAGVNLEWLEKNKFTVKLQADFDIILRIFGIRMFALRFPKLCGLCTKYIISTIRNMRGP
jgi:hypothetical protein